jgi:hypothetical protein
MIERAELPVHKNKTLYGLLIGLPRWDRDTSGRCAQLRLPAATVLGEIGEQRVHGVEPRRIDHRAAAAPHGHKAGLAQPVEMKRQRVRWKPKPCGDFAGRQARPGPPAPAGDRCRAGCPGQEPRAPRRRPSFPCFHDYGNELSAVKRNCAIATGSAFGRATRQSTYRRPAALPASALPKRLRRHARLLAEEAREVRRVGKAQFECDLVDRLAGKHQRALGLGQYTLADQVARRLPRSRA